MSTVKQWVASLCKTSRLQTAPEKKRSKQSCQDILDDGRQFLLWNL